MAIRYSGDVEVRIQHVPRGTYKFALRAPGLNDRGQVKLIAKPGPDTYDRVARMVLSAAARHYGRRLPVSRRGGRIEILRVFRSPCPVL